VIRRALLAIVRPPMATDRISLGLLALRVFVGVAFWFHVVVEQSGLRTLTSDPMPAGWHALARWQRARSIATRFNSLPNVSRHSGVAPAVRRGQSAATVRL